MCACVCVWKLRDTFVGVVEVEARDTSIGVVEVEAKGILLL